ncbi:hypothetical protein [Luteolibacter sp. LG18]|uniref:hypothetical protein n=1 Tax=Luteolibacter sp. LG18 TaxID=2819286 RepID=UPI0030C6AF0D
MFGTDGGAGKLLWVMVGLLAAMVLAGIGLQGDPKGGKASHRQAERNESIHRDTEVMDGYLREKIRQVSGEPDGGRLDSNRSADLKSASEDMRKLQTFIDAEIAGRVAINTGYQDEINRSGFADFLSAGHLGDDASYQTAGENIAKGRAIMERWKERQEVYEADSSRRLAEADLPPHVRQGLEMGAVVSGERKTKDAAAFWALEQEKFAGLEELLKMLEETREAWGTVDGKIAFERKEDLERFNGLFDGLTQIAGKQQELRKQALEAVKKVVDSP